MTSRLEWLTARSTSPVVLQPGIEAPDGQTPERPGAMTLVLSHGDSYGVAIEGTEAELKALLLRALKAVKR